MIAQAQLLFVRRSQLSQETDVFAVLSAGNIQITTFFVAQFFQISIYIVGITGNKVIKTVYYVLPVTVIYRFIPIHL